MVNYHNHTVPGNASQGQFTSTGPKRAFVPILTDNSLLSLNQQKRKNGCINIFMTKSSRKNRSILLLTKLHVPCSITYMYIRSL